MPTITWALEADFDRDGTYETALGSYVTAEIGGRIRLARGVDPRGEPESGAMRVTLENAAGEFSPRNLSGTFAKYVRAGFPIRVTATHDGIGYSRWTGYCRDISWESPSDGLPSVEIDCDTLFGRLKEAPLIYVSASSARDTDGAIEAIRVAAGLPSDAVDLKDGQQDLPWHFVAGQNPQEAILAAAQSELGGKLYELGSGAIAFEGRERRRGVSQLDLDALDDGAVALWRFREATGSTVYDLSGNGHALTLSGSPARGADGLMTPHDPAKATDFDGSNDYGTVTDHADLDTGDTFTWEFVVEVDGLAAQQVVLFKGTNGLTVSITTAGEVSLDKAGVANIGTSTGAGITAGTPSHVIITKTGATIAIYVDGEDVTGTMTNQTIENTATDLSVGYYQPSANLHLDGRLGALALYPTALTATQVARHYQSFVGRKWGMGDGLLPVTDVEVIEDARDLLTSVEVRGTRFLEGQGDEVLFEFSANMFTRPDPTSVFFPANVPYKRRFQMKSAYVSLTAIETPLDYRFTENQDGSGADESANVAVTVTDLGGWIDLDILPSVDCYSAYFRIRGQSIEYYADRALAAVSESVDAVPVGRGLSFDVPFAGDSQSLMDYAQQELAVGRYPIARLNVRQLPMTDEEIAALLGRRIGDLIWYDDTGASPSYRGTYTKGWYYIEGEEDEIPAALGGESWPAETRLVPADVYRRLSLSAYDDFGRDDASGDLGTSLSGVAWANDTGMDLDTQQAVPNTNTAQVVYLELGALAWHQVVELHLAGMSGSDVEAGIAYGLVDTSNYYRCYVDRADSKLHLDVVVGGTPTQIAVVDWAPAAAAEIRVLLQEGRHRVHLDGYLVMDEEDFSLNTGTKAGVYTSAGVAEVAFTRFHAQGL